MEPKSKGGLYAFHRSGLPQAIFVLSGKEPGRQSGAKGKSGQYQRGIEGLLRGLLPRQGGSRGHRCGDIAAGFADSLDKVFDLPIVSSMLLSANSPLRE